MWGEAKSIRSLTIGRAAAIAGWTGAAAGQKDQGEATSGGQLDHEQQQDHKQQKDHDQQQDHEQLLEQQQQQDHKQQQRELKKR